MSALAYRRCGSRRSLPTAEERVRQSPDAGVIEAVERAYFDVFVPSGAPWAFFVAFPTGASPSFGHGGVDIVELG